jgi:hypothetical protein
VRVARAISSIWRLLSATALAAALVASTSIVDGRAAAPAPKTVAQVTKAFKAATGRTLAVDRGLTRPSRATALRLAPSVRNAALYGDFVVWVIAPGSDGAAEVTSLLSDTHTGALGTPGAAAIYWERGTSLSGAPYVLGKKRYGANLVLWRYGTAAKVDPSFSRLHKLLTALVAGR